MQIYHVELSLTEMNFHTNRLNYASFLHGSFVSCEGMEFLTYVARSLVSTKASNSYLICEAVELHKVFPEGELLPLLSYEYIRVLHNT